ncbi:hypothetical protein C9I98_09355 [Photobacterium sanctipauli]|uniref:Porin n=1 Tax=Photobacterium sanctipauli TaxID=1342794 RepID=A0A2T3NVJ7_9GAMM|nr:hypothetical protein [Photobacterium sanctipauli]PSW20251.1 hypothetical protein C9I98_09355 [Photobacterium sanctipauli]
MEIKKLLAASIIAGLSTTATAGTIEIGSEVEELNSEYKTSDFMLPYLKATAQPFEGVPLTISFKFSDRQMFEDEVAANGRARQEYGIDYVAYAGEKFTFAPGFWLRHNEYAGKNTTDTEYRIYPNMSYQLNDTFKVALNGFFAPHSQTTTPRGADIANAEDGERFDYSDYKHELDFQLHTAINDKSKFVTSFYNEYVKTNDVTMADEQALMNEWQLRLVYTYNFDNFSVSPFARINLHRSFENGAGEEKDQARNRFGVKGGYNFANDLTLVYEVYTQTEEKNNYDNTSDVDQDKMFYKLGVKYDF